MSALVPERWRSEVPLWGVAGHTFPLSGFSNPRATPRGQAIFGKAEAVCPTGLQEEHQQKLGVLYFAEGESAGGVGNRKVLSICAGMLWPSIHEQSHPLTRLTSAGVRELTEQLWNDSLPVRERQAAERPDAGPCRDPQPRTSHRLSTEDEDRSGKAT